LNRPSAAAMGSYVKINYFDHLFKIQLLKVNDLMLTNYAPNEQIWRQATVIANGNEKRRQPS